MGVDLEKYVGVVVDLNFDLITGDSGDFMENFAHGFDDTLYNPLKEELLALNFKRDFESMSDYNVLKEGNILIVADGMCGEYTYLMYVLAHDYVESSDDPCKSDEKVNELLAKLEPPVEILEKLGKVHELLLGAPLKEPRYLYLNHYS